MEGCRCEPAAALQGSLAQLLLFAQLFFTLNLPVDPAARPAWILVNLPLCLERTSTYWVTTVWEVFFIHQLMSLEVFCFFSLSVPSGYPVPAFTPCVELGPGSCSLSLCPASFIHQPSRPSPHSTHFQSQLPSLHLDCHYHFSPGWKESLNQPSPIHGIPLHPVLYWDPECFLKSWIRSVDSSTFLLWYLLLNSLWDTSFTLWPHSHSQTLSLLTLGLLDSGAHRALCIFTPVASNAFLLRTLWLPAQSPPPPGSLPGL